MFQAFGHTDKGSVRTSNEDCFAVDEGLQLCIVADGMGGHNAGEVAAQLAVSGLLDTIRGHYATESRDTGAPPGPSPLWPFGFEDSASYAANCLRTAVRVANAQILEASLTTAEYSGMGTTVVASLVSRDRLVVAHVGDSRFYLLDGAGLQLLTRDDSWAAEILGREGDIDPAVIRHHPMRGALTNVVGTRPQLDVHITELTLAGGERFLLSTDGVHGVLDDEWLERLLTRTEDLRETAAGVVEAALARGSRDNCTAVVARYSTDD